MSAAASPPPNWRCSARGSRSRVGNRLGAHAVPRKEKSGSERNGGEGTTACSQRARQIERGEMRVLSCCRRPPMGVSLGIWATRPASKPTFRRGGRRLGPEHPGTGFQLTPASPVGAQINKEDHEVDNCASELSDEPTDPKYILGTLRSRGDEAAPFAHVERRLRGHELGAWVDP